MDYQPHGYICKSCGNPAPMGIGYVVGGLAAAQASESINCCLCGYSRKPVTASLVPNGKRMDFLPQLFPGLYIHGEIYVYQNLESIADAYNGGYWNYYALSNGGFYMAPDIAETLHITVAGNFFDGDLSADAAGIVATLFALNRLMFKTAGTTLCDRLMNNFYALRDYAAEHPEHRGIYGAID